MNTAVSVSLLFHPVYGFFLTLKNLKNPQKERTYEVDEKSKDFLKTVVSVSLSFHPGYGFCT